jgi:two-component system CheB/CheR fusion protein
LLTSIGGEAGRDRVWINSENFAYHDPLEERPSVYSIGTDVTELIAERDRSQEALAQLVMLQQIAKVGYWALDLQNNDVFWSDEVFRIHGEDPKTYTPRFEEALAFFHPEDRESVRGHVEKVRANGGQFHFRHRLVNRAGATVNVESFGLARPTESGEVSRIIGVFRALDMAAE